MDKALLNVRSLSNKTFVINKLISEHNLDYLLLTETWLNSDRRTILIETSPIPIHAIADGLNCGNIPIGDFCSFEHHDIL